MDQQKIASILSKVDELIQKTDQVIERTQRLKKGMMQRLLTKGIGHTKFKTVLLGSKSLKIEIPESWTLASLSEVACIMDVRHQTPTYTDEGFPLILPNNVKLVGLDLENTKFTNEEDFLYMTGGGRHPVFGDIVYSRNASFGVACRIETDQKFSLGQDLVLIKPEKINSYVLCLILNSRFVNIQLVKLSTGSTFQRINLDLIRNFMIAYPVDATEQNKITENVQKIDNLIGSHKIYHDILIALKRGLCKIFLQAK